MIDKTSYFSFGHNHRHEIVGRIFDHNTIARITAPDPRAVMLAVFDRRWYFEYADKPDHPLMRDLPIIDVSIDMAEQPESEDQDDDVRPVILMVCARCREGEGDECHAPRCSFWLSAVPDLPPESVDLTTAGFVIAEDYEKVNAGLLIAEQDCADLRCQINALVSDHEGMQAVWVCDRCGQPIGEDGRCNSGTHVGPGDENYGPTSGHAISTTDLVVERDALRGALIHCVEFSGADTSDGMPTDPPLHEWAVECVRVLREEHDELLSEIQIKREALSKRLEAERSGLAL